MAKIYQKRNIFARKYLKEKKSWQKIRKHITLNLGERKENMFSELTVTIKDDEKRLSKKFALYEVYTASADDQIVKDCIAETLKNFAGDPESVKVRIDIEAT